LLTGFLPRIALSLPAASLLGVLLMPETLASTILRRKASKLNKENANTGKQFVAPSDLNRGSLWITLVSDLIR
jgi:heme oxygenase